MEAFVYIKEALMPTYEFDCLKCNHAFTMVWSVGEYEEALRQGVRCPKCDSTQVEQKVSAQVQTSRKS